MVSVFLKNKEANPGALHTAILIILSSLCLLAMFLIARSNNSNYFTEVGPEKHAQVGVYLEQAPELMRFIEDEKITVFEFSFIEAKYKELSLQREAETNQ